MLRKLSIFSPTFLPLLSWDLTFDIIFKLQKSRQKIATFSSCIFLVPPPPTIYHYIKRLDRPVTGKEDATVHLNFQLNTIQNKENYLYEKTCVNFTGGALSVTWSMLVTIVRHETSTQPHGQLLPRWFYHFNHISFAQKMPAVASWNISRQFRRFCGLQACPDFVLAFFSFKCLTADE